MAQKKKVVRHLPRTWECIDNILVVDPDGWRHDNKSWNAPLTKEEWIRRMTLSTVMGNFKKQRS